MIWLLSSFLICVALSSLLPPPPPPLLHEADILEHDSCNSLYDSLVTAYLEHDGDEVAAAAPDVDRDVPQAQLRLRLQQPLLRHPDTIGHLASHHHHYHYHYHHHHYHHTIIP